MNRSTKPGPASEADAASASDQPKHFDTFETRFFEQGDVTHPQISVERFEDLDEPAAARKRAPSRQFLLGIAAGGACAAVLGCVALWRGSQVSPKPAVAASAPPSVAAAPPPVASDPPIPAESAATLAAPGPVPPPAAAPPAAAPVPAVEPAPATTGAAEGRPAAVAEVATPDPDAVRAGCETAIRRGRARQIARACADAFAADPTAAALAVAVAKAEFDRGRSAQALTWGKKAVAADPSVADAYVFIGGAEQNAGHGKAAKEAYQRYLDLAPRGRYAADLRVIVGRL